MAFDIWNNLVRIYSLHVETDSPHTMKRQVLGLLGVLLFVFCLLMVSWQLYQGTKKYMAEPLANKIYSAQAELPVIMVCHADDKLKIPKTKGMKHSDFRKGDFMSILDNMTAEEVFDEATDHHYDLLDYTGCIIFMGS